MAETHVFKNLSGIEYEVGCMTAFHQRLISQKTGNVSAEGIEKVLADLIYRVGLITIKTMSEKERIDFIMRLPSMDRLKSLFEIQQFTNDFSKSFSFVYSFESVDNENKGAIVEEVIEIDFTNKISEKPYPRQVTELSDFQWEQEGVFPRNKDRYKYRLADGLSEHAMAKDKNYSSHTPILQHYPARLKTKNKQGEDLKEPVWIKIGSDELDKLSIPDIEHLRKDIYDNEARFNTRIAFEHPQAHLLPINEKKIIIDIIQMPSFYYPSGTF